MKIAAKNNNGLTNEGYYVNAADLADEIAVLMQYGLDPLFISTSTWALSRHANTKQSTERKRLLTRWWLE
jgi:hypothetical protein